MEWLWLEDQEGTVAGLRAEVEKELKVSFFTRVPDLTRYLLQRKDDVEAGHVGLGFILDVMITNVHAIVRPAGWYGCEREAHFTTENGFWAGLVYYKELILGGVEEGKALIHPPPPVAFLTVMHSQTPDARRRLQEVRTAWGLAARKPGGEPKVRWFRKADTKPQEFLKILGNWEEVVA